MERKLASIQRIAEIQSIPNADNIVKYRINGWWVAFTSTDMYTMVTTAHLVEHST